jgi:hypothetical protein
MANFKYLNVSPDNEQKNDCVTRAITLACGISYSEARKKLYHTSKLLDCESKLCPTCYGFAIQQVLGGVPKNCEGMSVREFADRNPKGIYLIRIQGHLTCLIDGVCYDTWNCLDKICDIAWRVA